MSEKRFVPITEQTKVGEIQAIYDNEEEKTYRNVHSICGLLNKFYDENEQLSKEHQEMLEKYILLRLKIGEILNDE